MNLLFVCDEYPPGPHGGIGSVVQSLARALVRQGHKIWVVGLYDYGYGGPDYEQDEGVEVYRLRKGGEGWGTTLRYTLYDKVVRKIFLLTGKLDRDTQIGLRNLQEFINTLIVRHNIQLVEIPDYQHYTRQVRKAVFFPVPTQVPTVCRLHGSNSYAAAEAGREVPQHIYAMEQHLLLGTTIVSSVSLYTGNQTSSLFNLKNPIKIIYNGVPVGLPVNQDLKDPLKAIFTGSLAASKGILVLLEAWNKVIDVVPQARLEVWGKGTLAPLKAILNESALAQVSFKGHQPRPNVIESLRTSSIAIFPYFAEAFALAPLEAMAAGTATVYSKRTSGPEVITNGEDGLLIDPTDVEALAEVLLDLFHNPQLRKRLGEAAYQKVKSHFAIETIAQESAQFYQSLISAQQV